MTLDPDVEALLRAAMKQQDLSFKQAVNEAIRAGLGRPPARRKPFSQQTYSMGAEPHFRWDKALAEAAAMEDEEISRKIALRK